VAFSYALIRFLAPGWNVLGRLPGKAGKPFQSVFCLLLLFFAAAEAADKATRCKPHWLSMAVAPHFNTQVCVVIEVARLGIYARY